MRNGLIALGAALVLIGTMGCSPAGDADENSTAVPDTSVDGSAEQPEAPETEPSDTVTVTFPAGLFQGASEDDILAGAESSGFTDVTINDDGSVTYVMPRDVHDGLVAEARAGIDGAFEEASQGSPGVFESYTVNDEVTEIAVTVDRAAFDADFSAGFVVLTLGVASAFYQLVQGVPEEERGITVDFVDAATDEVFSSQTWPSNE